MSEQKQRSPEEVERIMANADGALGAAGHQVTDPEAREIIRQSVAGEISVEEAKQQILQKEGLTVQPKPEPRMRLADGRFG